MTKDQKKYSIISIGDRFTNCEVIGFKNETKVYNGKSYKKILCVCQCDCGDQFNALKHNLRNKRTTSCGPCKKKLNGSLKVRQLNGQTFGRLIVIARNGSNKTGQALWLCRCKCGAEITTKGSLLIRGETKSCGCLSVDKSKAKRVKHEGKVIGNLTVIKYLGNQKYQCICTCGNTVKKKSDAIDFI